MGLDWKALDAAKRRRALAWAQHDNVLYEMCRTYPRHSDAASVNAKVGIIARAYATGIERKIPSDKTQGSSLLKLTNFVTAHGREVDAALVRLRRLTEPLTSDKLESVVESHGTLVEMLRPLLRGGQSSRSFWSKYLHFHCPVVPVYDSYVASALSSLMRWNAGLQVFHPRKPFDEVYCTYSMRFLALYERVKIKKPKFTVKELDFYLLSL